MRAIAVTENQQQHIMQLSRLGHTVKDIADRLGLARGTVSHYRVLLGVGLRKVSTRRGVESINLRLGNAISAIDDVIEENAEKALAPSSLSLGAVRGRLYRYTNDTVRKRRSAGLRRTDTGEAIELRFAPDDAAKVRAHLERDVEVWGEITRDATGQVAQLVVEGIEPIDAPGQGASASEGRGLLGSDWAGGIDPAEWVRTMRG